MTKTFKEYLNEIGEIGVVEEILGSVVRASGLPEVHPDELVIFETGEHGQVIGIKEEYCEILLISQMQIKVGIKVTRTNEKVKVALGEALLGHIVNPLGNSLDGATISGKLEQRLIDQSPPGLAGREVVNEILETGVGIVDLVIPIGKGQRELVIGERKTGKTNFLFQVLLSQAQKGSICIYACIGQRQTDIMSIKNFIKESGIEKNTCLVVTTSSDPAGLIFLTPYTAMTLAEYFRDQGHDVLLILDDLTSHARFYREISLLSGRFPGRNSYPGDIFYVHAKIMERAGNFQKGSISCLPVAESVQSDLSGFIQTNLMAMTDGHLFFDMALYNKGKRPAVNPFLSVTRVGHQAQNKLARDLSRELNSFLVYYNTLEQFMHFGAELTEKVRQSIGLGRQLEIFLNQPENLVAPLNINMALLASLWAGIWKEETEDSLGIKIQNAIEAYKKDPKFKAQIDQIVEGAAELQGLISAVKEKKDLFVS